MELSKIGNAKVKLHRSAEGIIKTCTIVEERKILCLFFYVRNKYKTDDDVSSSNGIWKRKDSSNSNKTFYASAYLNNTVADTNKSKSIDRSAGLSAGLGDASAPLGEYLSFGAKGPSAELSGGISLNKKNIKKSGISVKAMVKMAEVSGTIKIGKVKITGSVSFLSFGREVEVRPVNLKLV